MGCHYIGYVRRALGPDSDPNRRIKMYPKTELESKLDHAVTSLLKNKGDAFTVGELEVVLISLLRTSGVPEELKAELVSRLEDAADASGTTSVTQW